MRSTRSGMLFAFWLFRSELDCFSSKPAGQCGSFVMSALDAISVFPVLYVAVRAICWEILLAFSQFSSISEVLSMPSQCSQFFVWPFVPFAGGCCSLFRNLVPFPD